MPQPPILSSADDRRASATVNAEDDAHSAGSCPGPSGRQTLEAGSTFVDPLDPPGCAGNSPYSATVETQIQYNPSLSTFVNSANIEEHGDWEDGKRFRVMKRSARADWPSGYHQSKSIKSREDAMPQLVSAV